MVQLTSGVIKTIVTSSNDEMPPNPILQILGIKKLAASKGVDRFRLVFSDGVNYYTSGMLATQLNDMVLNEEIDAKAVVQLVKYHTNIIQQQRRIIVVLDMVVLEKADDVPGKIGSPEQLSDNVGVLDKLAAEMHSNASNGTHMQNRSAPASNGTHMQQQQQPSNQYNQPKTSFGGQQQNRGAATPQARSNPYGGAASNSAFYGGGSKMNARPTGTPGGQVVHPINSLTPYQNRWMIRARVTNKSQIRTWSNSKGEGKLFSVDLLDESGEIKATGFTDAVDKFYERFEIGKVYFISKCSLRTANKQYTSLKNDYEMYLNADSIVEACTEDVDLPQIQFNFVNIGDLENVNKDAMVDIIGVVKSMGDVTQITTRANNRQVSKREVVVVDRSETAVNVTLWGQTAEKFEEHAGKNPVIAVKGAKVSDFGGRSLSVVTSSNFSVDPDIPEAHALRGWYDQVGKDSGVKSISGQGSSSGPGQFKTIGQIRSENLGMGEKADYFSIKATPVFLKKENCLYKACPSGDCNKKVIEDGGEYRCEKCNKTYQDFKYRLIMSANVCDCTGNMWLTCFQDSGEALLSTTTENIGQLKENDEKAFEDIFTEAAFKPFTLKLRAKMETYNDEARFKATCVAAAPLNFKTEGKRLLEEIKKLEAL